VSCLAFGVTAFVWAASNTEIHLVGTSTSNCVQSAPVFSLPAAERRRLNPLSTFALAACDTLARTRSAEEIRTVPLVYASPNGDGALLLRLLTSIGEHQPFSPTQFHNSVHNAPAGYWSIGINSRAATTALAAGDETLEVALAEAGLQVVSRDCPVMLIVAQQAYPQELRTAQPAAEDFVLAAWCIPANERAAWRCSLLRDSGGVRSASSLAADIAVRGEHGFAGRRFVDRLACTLDIRRISE